MGFINDDTVVIDITHFEARDQAPPKAEKLKSKPKKRGRKSKGEREKRLIGQAEMEANSSLYERRMESQLDIPLAELRSEVPQDPKWDVKKNSEGKNVF